MRELLLEADESEWCRAMADREQVAEPKFWALHVAAGKRVEDPAVLVPPLPRDGHSVGGICWLKEESGSIDEAFPPAMDCPITGQPDARAGKN
jgi:hypothetical protein